MMPSISVLALAAFVSGGGARRVPKALSHRGFQFIDSAARPKGIAKV
jgi:hypothetical protein